MELSNPYYKACLEAELARRSRKNPRYSLRAFARALEVDAGVLSRALGGKRPLSLKAGRHIVERLALSPDERALFLDSVAHERKGRDLRSAMAERPEAAASEGERPQEIDRALFDIIGDWHHYAILELTFTEGFRSDPRWIAAQLGISPLEARLAVERLKSVGLLADEAGTLKKTKKTILTDRRDAATPALTRHQRQLLDKAAEALDNEPFARRHAASMAIPIDPDKLDVARRMIEEFSLALCRYLCGGRMREVYELTVHLFPVQRRTPP